MQKLLCSLATILTTSTLATGGITIANQHHLNISNPNNLTTNLNSLNFNFQQDNDVHITNQVKNDSADIYNFFNNNQNIKNVIYADNNIIWAIATDNNNYAEFIMYSINEKKSEIISHDDLINLKPKNDYFNENALLNIDLSAQVGHWKYDNNNKVWIFDNNYYIVKTIDGGSWLLISNDQTMNPLLSSVYVYQFFMDENNKFAGGHYLLEVNQQTRTILEQGKNIPDPKTVKFDSPNHRITLGDYNFSYLNDKLSLIGLSNESDYAKSDVNQNLTESRIKNKVAEQFQTIEKTNWIAQNGGSKAYKFAEDTYQLIKTVGTKTYWLCSTDWAWLNYSYLMSTNYHQRYYYLLSIDTSELVNQIENDGILNTTSYTHIGNDSEIDPLNKIYSFQIKNSNGSATILLSSKSQDSVNPTYSNIITKISTNKEDMFDKWLEHYLFNDAGSQFGIYKDSVFFQDNIYIDTKVYQFSDWKFIKPDDANNRLDRIVINDGEFLSPTDLTTQGTKYCSGSDCNFNIQWDLKYNQMRLGIDNPITLKLHDKKTDINSTFNFIPDKTINRGLTLRNQASSLKITNQIENGANIISTNQIDVSPSQLAGITSNFMAYPMKNGVVDWDPTNAVIQLGDGFEKPNHDLLQDIANDWYVVDNSTLIPTYYIVKLAQTTLPTDYSQSLFTSLNVLPTINNVRTASNFWQTDNGVYLKTVLKNNNISNPDNLTTSGVDYSLDNINQFNQQKPTANYQDIIDAVGKDLSDSSNKINTQYNDFTRTNGDIDFASFKQNAVKLMRNNLINSSNLSNNLKSDVSLYDPKQFDIKVNDFSFSNGKVFYDYTMSWTPNGDKTYSYSGTATSLIDNPIEQNSATDVSTREIDVQLSEKNLTSHQIAEASDINNWNIDGLKIAKVEVDAKTGIAKLMFDTNIDIFKQYNIKLNDTIVQSWAFTDIAKKLPLVNIGQLDSKSSANILKAINETNNTNLTDKDIKITNITDNTAIITGLGIYAGSIKVSFSLAPTPNPTPDPTPTPNVIKNTGLSQGVIAIIVVLSFLVFALISSIGYSKWIKPAIKNANGKKIQARLEKESEQEKESSNNEGGE